MKQKKQSDLTPSGRKVRNDILLILVVTLLAVIGCLTFFLTGSAGDRVVVLIDGKESASYPLSEDLETVIRTDGESNTLVIRDGKARVLEATCPDGICVDHRPISKAGETIVCLPHKVVLKVISTAKNDLDIVA